jgi:hypothetical protein
MFRSVLIQQHSTHGYSRLTQVQPHLHLSAAAAFTPDDKPIGPGTSRTLTRRLRFWIAAGYGPPRAEYDAASLRKDVR